jgi:hypothetical protein
MFGEGGSAMRAKVTVFAFLLLAVAIAAALFPAAAQPADKVKGPAAAPKKGSEPTGKEDKVRDTVITIKTSYSTVDLHESINSENRFYVAPHFRFLLLEPDKKAIARPSRDAETGTVPVQMSIEMVHPEIRAELVTLLRNSGREVSITDIRNLQVDSIRVGVAARQDRELYGAEDFVLANPQAGAEKLAVNLSVLAPKARQFAEAVNEGKVNFIFSYSYNQISLDSRVEMLRASTFLDTQQVRELTLKGAELMSARQMAEAATNIKREIESKVIEGIGKIEPQSLPVERLMKEFSVGETWKMTEKQLEEMDQRLRKQFDLKVDAKDFQPARYQKRVIEALDKQTGVANKKKAYFDLYRMDKEGMKVSAGLKLGPFGASGEYSKEFEQKMNKGDMSEDEFREHVKTYHGAEYTKEMVEFRGVELYDVQKVRAMGELRIISVTLKPTLGTGLRNVTQMPTRDGALYVDRRFVAIEDRLKRLPELEAKVAALEKARIAVQTVDARIYSMIKSPGPGSLAAEVWHDLDRARLSLPKEATILGAWVSHDGVAGTLRNPGGDYSVPNVELEIHADRVRLRPRDFGAASTYNQRIFVHCLYKLP